MQAIQTVKKIQSLIKKNLFLADILPALWDQKNIVVNVIFKIIDENLLSLSNLSYENLECLHIDKNWKGNKKNHVYVIYDYEPRLRIIETSSNKLLDSIDPEEYHRMTALVIQKTIQWYNTEKILQQTYIGIQIYKVPQIGLSAIVEKAGLTSLYVKDIKKSRSPIPNNILVKLDQLTMDFTVQVYKTGLHKEIVDTLYINLSYKMGENIFKSHSHDWHIQIVLSNQRAKITLAGSDDNKNLSLCSYKGKMGDIIKLVEEVIRDLVGLRKAV